MWTRWDCAGLMDYIRERAVNVHPVARICLVEFAETIIVVLTTRGFVDGGSLGGSKVEKQMKHYLGR